MTEVNKQSISQIVELRHELHRLAEPSGKESKTAARIQEILEDCSPDQITKGLGGAGLVATFEGVEDGPSVMLRCELDALPILEENEIEYRSRNEGFGHKCGHDGHMAIILGVAKFLQHNRPAKGRVHLLFQPAEETGQGALRLLNDHKFKSYEPDYIFALHNLPGYPLNQIILRDGVFASASRGFEVKLKGDTSHAAHPENGNSPALALSNLIQHFSAFPQYYTSLDDSAKVTVINAKLGEIAFGTSPGYAEFRATLRTYQNRLMETLCGRAEEVVENIARTYNLEFSYQWTELFEVTKSDPECNRMIEQAASEGGKEIFRKEAPFPWSEDFGRFTSRYKGALFGIGAGEDHPPLHSAMYDFPDKLIPTATTIFVDVLKQITGFKD